MAKSRTLTFENFDQVISDLDNLKTNGYEQTGDWDLSQCCQHLNHWITFPVQGFPRLGILMGTVMWLMKVTTGKKMLNSILEDGFKDGTPTMPATVAKPGTLGEAEAVEMLQESVRNFVNHNGIVHPSPLFGEMTREVATKLQLRHFEHHLGFFSPAADSSE